MTKGEALHKFFSRFEMPAYPLNAVPKDVVLPYLTYTPVTAAFEEGEVSITVDCWFYTDSQVIPNAKAQEISARIGRGGTTIRCEDGFVWLKRGSPFCQNVEEPNDKNIKRRHINVDAEFFTTD